MKDTYTNEGNINTQVNIVVTPPGLREDEDSIDVSVTNIEDGIEG